MVTTSDISEVRKRSGAGILNCKKALDASSGDIEAALLLLRKQGLAAASKRSHRTASEGLVAIAVHENSATVIELNCETDFASRNDSFKTLASDIAKLALTHNVPAEELIKIKTPKGTIEEQITALAGSSIQENISLRRIKRLSLGKGSLHYYLHGKVSTDLARIISLVAIQCSATSPGIADLGKKISMQIAAQAPKWLDEGEVDNESIENERSVAKEQLKNSNKPANVEEKIIEGRIGKFLDENCLLRQKSIFDSSMNIKNLVESSGKEIGAKLNVCGFIRMEVGEGIEKEKHDFAAEVASAAKT